MSKHSITVAVAGVVTCFVVMVGGCSYTAGKCVESGGEWDGNYLSCER